MVKMVASQTPIYHWLYCIHPSHSDKPESIIIMDKSNKRLANQRVSYRVYRESRE